jgi:flagellar hook-length control protein FliK
VIRLEPPMLGRVEIAIRHSAGSLEVHISATNGEVLRQLQTVSDNLRNDLAQRQFTEVAVNIAQAPRGRRTARRRCSPAIRSRAAGASRTAANRNKQPGPRPGRSQHRRPRSR